MHCPERKLCGPICMKPPFFDCLEFCCGQPEVCDRVCRNHPDYVDRVREVNHFDLGNVARAALLDAPPLPRVVPMIFHGKRRQAYVPSSTVALPLFKLLDRVSGKLKFNDHKALCEAFKIAPGSTLILSGTDRDPPLERWWQLGSTMRRQIIRALVKLGVDLVTTPNYSLFSDRPRWDDLHAMKRIAIIHQEFLAEGMPAALHVNGRADADFYRWMEYVVARPEITHLAYEFTTGTGWAERQDQHARWLADLAKAVGRPLHLVVRGGVKVFPQLVPAFAGITCLDTSAFMKTIKRQQAIPDGNQLIAWQRAPTLLGEPLDDLLADNWTKMEALYRDQMALPIVVEKPSA